MSIPAPATARRWIPRWLRSYDRDTGVQDMVAGVVVTVLLVPQSLAYAMLAGLPPHVGLYASILPLLAYAALGSSMTLAVGPVAIASVMTASALAPLAIPGTPEYLTLAVLLALLGGAQLMLLGVLRFGFVANLLSHPVISGFITGTALLIALGQLRPLLGIEVRNDTAMALLAALPRALPVLHPPTAIIGFASILLLLGARHFMSPLLQRAGLARAVAEILARLAPMAVILFAVAAVAIGSLDTAHGVAVVGAIPSGLPSLALVMPTNSQLAALMVPAFLIALVGFVESVAVAQSFATKRGERIDPNAELLGLGAANLASGVSGSLPVTGGFARSVVNASAGARTPMAGVVAAMLMALVLLGFTGLFERLPLAVLAATIIVAVLGLVDLATPRHAWRYDRADALAWGATGAGVLALGVEVGIAIGIALSVGTFLWRASRPHIAVVGRLPGTEHFRNVDRHRVDTLPGVLMLRIDENLFFGNLASTLDRIQLELARHPEARHLVLVMSSVSHVDLTAAEALLRLQSDLAFRQVRLHLAEVKGPVLDRLKTSGWLARLDHEPYLSAHAAYEALCAARNPQD
jgi:sulfate permease, SulP family